MAQITGILPRVDFISRSEMRYRCLTLRCGLTTSNDSGDKSSGGGGGGKAGGNGTRALTGSRDGGGRDGNGGGGGYCTSWSLCSDPSRLSSDASLTICESTTVAIGPTVSQHQSGMAVRSTICRAAVVQVQLLSLPVTRTFRTGHRYLYR